MNKYSDRIDEIYAQLKAQEKAKKEKYLIAILVSACVLFFILISSVILTRPSEPLNIRQEQGNVDANGSSFIEEAHAKPEPVSAIDSDKLNSMNVSEAVDIPKPVENLPDIELEITGDLVSVSKLSFHIVNFNPDYIYRVDFGNGEGKRVMETFNYSYIEPGFFELKITAYGKNKSKKKYKKVLDIKPWEHV